MVWGFEWIWDFKKIGPENTQAAEDCGPRKKKVSLALASSLGSSFFSSSSNNPLNKQHAVNLAT